MIVAAVEIQNGKIAFRGNRRLFLKQVFLFGLVIIPSFNVMILGEKGLLASAWILPVIVLFSLPLSFLEKFTLNDSDQRVVRIFGPGVPYDRVGSVTLHEGRKSIAVRISTGRFSHHTLVTTLPADEKASLIQELSARFPAGIVRHAGPLHTRLILILLAFCLFVIIALHLFLYQKNPEIRNVASAKAFPVSGTTGMKIHSAQGVSVSLPGEFLSLPSKDGILLLEGSNVRLHFTSALDAGFVQYFYKRPLQRSLFRHVLGIHDAYDVVHTAFTSRLGAFPLIMRSLLIGDLRDTSIYQTAKHPLAGFVVTGRTDTGHRAVLTLFNRSLRKEVTCTFISSGPIGDEVIGMVVNGMVITGGPAAGHQVQDQAAVASSNARR